MLGVTRLEDFTIKHHDIDTLRIQLTRDGTPVTIPEGSVVTMLIQFNGVLVYEEPIAIIDYEKGIVEVRLSTSEFGVGEFLCEYVLTNENDENLHLTFPDNGFDTIKITPSLLDRGTLKNKRRN